MVWTTSEREWGKAFRHNTALSQSRTSVLETRGPWEKSKRGRSAGSLSGGWCPEEVF